MSWRVHQDRGQAAPLYITAVGGLLFLALLFFAFGKADAARNGTQSAADAAALAAAQESRDQLKDGFLRNILDGDWLRDILNGDLIGTYDGCRAAARFAQLNDAGGVRCGRLPDGRWGFTVDVVSNKPVGKTVLPGTEGRHAEATATAVVEPRCSLEPAESPGGGGPAPTPGGSGGGSGADEETKPSPGTITCDGKDWVIDPDHLNLLPDMADLFIVRLAED